MLFPTSMHTSKQLVCNGKLIKPWGSTKLEYTNKHVFRKKVPTEIKYHSQVQVIFTFKEII
jgi:hypothetical protein